MLAADRSGSARVSSRGHALRAIDAVVAEKCAQVGKVCFKRIEERERFGGIDEIEVAAKADRVAIEAARNVVDQLKARFAIKVRVAAIHSRRESVRQFQVRLRRNRREIK